MSSPLHEEIKQLKEEIDCVNKKIVELEEKRDETQRAFEEYNAKCQVIDVERVKIKAQIDALKERNSIE